MGDEEKRQQDSKTLREFWEGALLVPFMSAAGGVGLYGGVWLAGVLYEWASSGSILAWIVALLAIIPVFVLIFPAGMLFSFGPLVLYEAPLRIRSNYLRLTTQIVATSEVILLYVLIYLVLNTWPLFE